MSHPCKKNGGRSVYCYGTSTRFQMIHSNKFSQITFVHVMSNKISILLLFQIHITEYRKIGKLFIISTNRTNTYFNRTQSPSILQ